MQSQQGVVIFDRGIADNIAYAGRVDNVFYPADHFVREWRFNCVDESDLFIFDEIRII